MQDTKTFVERFLTDCVNDDLGRIEEFVAEDFVGHDFPTVGDIHGPDEFTAFFEGLRESFDGMEAVVTDVLSEGDRVVVRAVVTGTHAGPFCGVEPTGERIEMSGIRIFRIEGGKIAEIWLNLGVAEVLDQLGALSTDVDLRARA